jgi:diguanylate cyclase (GGDEF)-like protein
MPNHDLDTLARLRVLLDVTRAVRDESDLDAVLDTVARTVAEALGYRAVVVNLYRPAFGDFVVTTVHDYLRDARDQLLGTSGDWESWEPLLDERFERRGAHFVPAGEFDWSGVQSYTPDIEIREDDPEAWHPDDALFVTMRHPDGRMLGILSVDEPVSGMRPTDEELDVLVAVGEHAAVAVQNAQESAAAARHRRSLESLLEVSSTLNETLSTDAVLQLVAEGIRRALGFEKISIELPDPASGILVPRSTVGWSSEQLARNKPISTDGLTRLLEKQFEVDGCYLLTLDEARARLPGDHTTAPSVNNGRTDEAWNRHWLIVPLRDRQGELTGVIWVDDPGDRLLPGTDTLQALRVFANQAAAALDSAAHFEEVRFLAEHDALTGLLNRRAFTRQLGIETARSGRYHRPFALVLLDLDGFKQLNDAHGHQAGDQALRRVGELLLASIRSSDLAFRIGGDEFALVMPETDEQEVRTAVDRIAEGLRAPSELRALHASFGVSVFPHDGQEPEMLFRAADDAMYSAKRCGELIHFAA